MNAPLNTPASAFLDNPSRRTPDRFDLMLRVIRTRMRLHFAVSRKGPRDARKIFVIGHPRCGTTSLHTLMSAGGINSKHTSRDWVTADHDAFSDFGQVRPVAAFDRHYRNATFILNCRPVRSYLISLPTQIHPTWAFQPQHAVNEIYRRAAHFSWVLDRFRDRANCFVVNIEAPGAMDFVSDQLGLPAPDPSLTVPRNEGKRPPTPDLIAAVDAGLKMCGMADMGHLPFMTLPELQGHVPLGSALGASGLAHHL